LARKEPARLKYPSIITRYVFREISVSFVFCFSVFLFAGLIAGFLPLLQKGMEAGLELTLILFQVLINAMPGTLVTVLPLSITIGILLGLGRMASDNEMAAIKSSGVSIWRLLPPTLALGLIGFLLSLLCTLVLIPKGISEGRRLLNEAATRRVDAGIEERTFFDSLKNLVLYVEKKDLATGLLHHVFIRESSQPDEIQTIIARQGQVRTDPEGKALILNLRNGTIVREDGNGDATGSLAFESYVFRYPLDKTKLEASKPTFEELSISEIHKRVRELITEENKNLPGIEIYRRRVEVFAGILIAQRFVHPLACIALALAAFPLGALYLGKSRLNNVSIGLAAVFVYYAFTLATERVARSYLAPPEIVLPLPPLIFIIVSVYFTRCLDLERAPSVFRLLPKSIFRARPKAD
jgi:lipopolysaccharide export system permease protein